MAEIKGGLTPEQVKAILTKSQRKGKKKTINTNIRDVQTWFALSPQTRDNLEQIDLRCENPDCVDPRPGKKSPLTGEIIKHQFVVEISGIKICRFCFLDGYLLENPAQLAIPND